MKELELSHPKNHHGSSGEWRLFNKKNHRCNNKYATYEELQNVFIEWEPDNSPVYCGLSKIHEIDKYDISWLKRCLLPSESIDDIYFVCVYEEIWIHHEISWFKVVLFDIIKNRYILRTVVQSTNLSYYASDYIKNLPLSHDPLYKVDLSTLGSTEQFWIHLRGIIVGNIHKMSLKYITN